MSVKSLFPIALFQLSSLGLDVVKTILFRRAPENRGCSTKLGTFDFFTPLNDLLFLKDKWDIDYITAGWWLSVSLCECLWYKVSESSRWLLSGPQHYSMGGSVRLLVKTGIQSQNVKIFHKYGSFMALFKWASPPRDVGVGFRKTFGSQHFSPFLFPLGCVNSPSSSAEASLRAKSRSKCIL